MRSETTCIIISTKIKINRNQVVKNATNKVIVCKYWVKELYCIGKHKKRMLFLAIQENEKRNDEKIKETIYYYVTINDLYMLTESDE